MSKTTNLSTSKKQGLWYFRRGGIRIILELWIPLKSDNPVGSAAEGLKSLVGAVYTAQETPVVVSKIMGVSSLSPFSPILLPRQHHRVGLGFSSVQDVVDNPVFELIHLKVNQTCASPMGLRSRVCGSDRRSRKTPPRASGSIPTPYKNAAIGAWSSQSATPPI